MLNFLRKIIPQRVLLFYHWCWAVLANIIYRFPGRQLKVVGVTGTSGKTTTAILIGEVLKTAGYKVGLLTTNFVEIDKEKIRNISGFTTAGRLELQRNLRRMIKAGCEWAVIEVTSQGLVQYRVWGIPFDLGVFTNLSHEHLDLHKTMTAYRDAKAILFKNLKNSLSKGVPKTIVANIDNKYGNYFLQFPAEQKFAFGFKEKEIKEAIGIFATKIIPSFSGNTFQVKIKDKTENFKIPLLGRFNVYNALGAICVGLALKIDLPTIKEALKKVTLVEGRMEEISLGQPFKVFIDYALTPDAVEKLYSSLRELTSGRIIAVFGCAGERDYLKRPIIGEIAARLVDEIILTDDEPYREDPEIIIEQIKKGIRKIRADFLVIRDRRQAIKKALKMARPSDIVIITGLGHETVRNIGGKLIPWDDRKVTRQLLKEILNKKEKENA